MSRNRWRCGAPWSSGRCLRFFFACHRAFQAASMHFDAESSIDGGDALRRGQIGLFGLEVGDEVYHLGGDLMATFWSSRPRYEAGQPRCHYRTLSLIEGGARDTEGCCGERELLIRIWTHGFLITLRDKGHGRYLSYCGAS